MIETLYIETAIANHPRTRRIVARFPKARRIECQRYSEVFNRNAQNFRLQKIKPALILASKHGKTVLPTPKGYGIGGQHNYYFSHMLNCVYDCRYCFLQGMYRSGNYVLFVNYEDFYQEMDSVMAQHTNQPVWFFSGYDCDSLALEPLSGFIDKTLRFFQNHDQAQLELRTKSTQIRALLKHPPMQNCIVAYSLNPQAIVQSLEYKTPAPEKRLEALKILQQAGWPIGLRFDPVIYTQAYQTCYQALFEQVFCKLDASKIHSTSLGAFRLPQNFFHKVVSLYPQEKLFAAKITVQNKQAGYPRELEREMLSWCREQLLRYIPENTLFITGDQYPDHA